MGLAGWSAQTFADFEALVVGNALTDGSVGSLRFPDLRLTLIRHGSNIRFAAAKNFGARRCCASWPATLISDAEGNFDWLEEMQRKSECYPEIRTIGATLMNAADPSIVDGYGDALSIARMPWRCGHGQLVANLLHSDAEVFSPCAAAALYAGESFVGAGGFDEFFFCYLEDVDSGLRRRLVGERCMQLRSLIGSHHGSAIAGRVGEFTICDSYRNRQWIIIKNMLFPSSDGRGSN